MKPWKWSLAAFLGVVCAHASYTYYNRPVQLYGMGCVFMDRPALEIQGIEFDRDGDIIEIKVDNHSAVYRIRDGELCFFVPIEQGE